MTFQQFKRMKPKYQRRIVMVYLIAFLLFVAFAFGLAKAISFVQLQLNTIQLKITTASNLLQKETMNEILGHIKQDDPAMLLVLDSSVTMKDAGPDFTEVTSVRMHLLNIKDANNAEFWEIRADEEKAFLRKNKSRYENMTASTLRKVRFTSYFPALSRITSPLVIKHLQSEYPVGVGGEYTFTDEFGNNLSPEYAPLLQNGLAGVWISSLGGPSKIEENFKHPNQCAPTVVRVAAVDPNKSKGKRVVLTEPVDKLVMLFEVGPYTN